MTIKYKDGTTETNFNIPYGCLVYRKNGVNIQEVHGNIIEYNESNHKLFLGTIKIINGKEVENVSII